MSAILAKGECQVGISSVGFMARITNNPTFFFFRRTRSLRIFTWLSLLIMIAILNLAIACLTIIRKKVIAP